jgi:nucleoside-diphosphate-sugar epimerase
MNVRIGRFHNIFGPEGAWRGGREKAPAALCRKVAEAAPGGEIEIWGDGKQTRSFLYIEECLDAVGRLMRSEYGQPMNIGSDEMVSINALAEMVIAIAGKPLRLRHVDGPIGVRGRNSDNTLIAQELGWRPSCSLREGLLRTYSWIEQQTRQ